MILYWKTKNYSVSNKPSFLNARSLKVLEEEDGLNAVRPNNSLIINDRNQKYTMNSFGKNCVNRETLTIELVI